MEKENVEIQWVMELNQTDWEILHDKAKKAGFKKTRDFINSEVSKFAKTFPTTKICQKKNIKLKNNYKIPVEHTDFFSNLSCRHSINISTFIMRSIIFPIIMEDYNKTIE